MIDVVRQINAVHRQVGSRVLETGEARVVIIRRVYDAPIDELWDACTNPERIPRWFLPISGELRLGGHYELEGNASGTIQTCEPPRRLSATWEYAGNVSWIEVRLTPTDNGATHLELEHIAPDDDQKWAEFGPGAVGVGWDLALMSLGRHLASDTLSYDPAAWSRREAGREFISLCSQRWCDASTAAGTDPTDARAAADRTTAFYTPESESAHAS